MVDLPLKEGRYDLADGEFVDVFDCTVVEILTEDGRSGTGEICPLGPYTCRRIRDLCVALGYPMRLEDSWGGDIVTAAIAALSHSTPERFRFSATDFNSYVTVSFADGAPQRVDGRMRASDVPGLGVSLKRDDVGKAVCEYR